MKSDLARPVSVTLSFADWCLMIGVLSSIIESTIEYQDPQVRQQLQAFSRMREVIDKATD